MYKSFWANDGIWTRDLFLTKETLYPWATPAYGLSGLEFKVTSLARQNFNLFTLASKRFKFIWSGRPGSNRRHSAWKADALPTELLPHFFLDFHPKIPIFQKTFYPDCSDEQSLVGGAGFEPAKVKTNRFTVCPRWPLEYPPRIIWFSLKIKY